MDKKTTQNEFWESDFGKEYTIRNTRATIEDLDRIYKETRNITRTDMNNEFLGEFPKDIKILEVGCNIG